MDNHYYLVVSASGEFRKLLLAESKKIGTEIYQRELDGILYRVLTRRENDNPRKLFLKGDGNVVEQVVDPHLTIVGDFEFSEAEEELFELLQNVTNDFPTFEISTVSMGDYGQSFTFFIDVIPLDELNELRVKASRVVGRPMKKVKYVPHFTVLYDDANEEKVEEAKKSISVDSLVGKTVQVDKIWLWKVNKGRWKPYKSFNLSGPHE